MASFNSTYKIPKDASFVTLRNQNRMLYANAILQQQNQTQGCRATVGLQNGKVADADILPKLLEGARETTAQEVAVILASGSCPVVPPTPPEPVGGGSMLFAATESPVSVSYPNDASLVLGSGEFTIEWFQYLIENESFPRVFSIGSYDQEDVSIAVSYEGSFILWVNGSANFLTEGNPPYDVWTHIALVGDGAGSIKVYGDGELLATYGDGYDFTDSTTALAIGNETIPTVGATFSGNITNFRWVKGTQVYTEPFNPPTAPLTDIPGTQLLLLATDEPDVVVDSSSAAREPTNTDVTFSTSSPF